MATHWVLNTLPPGNSLRQHLGSFAEHVAVAPLHMCGGESEPTTCTNYWGGLGGSSTTPTHPRHLHVTHPRLHSSTMQDNYPGLPTQSQVSHTVIHVVNMARTCCPCMCSCADRSRWLYWMHRHTCTRAADCLLDVWWSVCNLLLEQVPTGIACHLLLEHFIERAYEDLKLLD